MKKQTKSPVLTHCKVTLQAHPKAPWRVTYDSEVDGKRVRLRKTFADEVKARRFAEDRDAEIKNHGVRYGDVPNELRRAYDFYRDIAADLRGQGSEVPTLENIISAAAADLRSRLLQKSLAEGVEEFLAYKKTRVKVRQHLNLTDHLKRFADGFPGASFASVTTQAIESWLSGLCSRHNPKKLAAPLPLSPLSRNHYRATAHTLFKYASDPARAWCSRNPVSTIEPETVPGGEPEAYTPEDSAKIMQAALDHDLDLVPALALEFFAGLRISEAVEVNLAKLTKTTVEFRVNADRKTGVRAVPLRDSCRAWLCAQPRRDGLAWIGGNDTRRTFHNRLSRLLRTAGVKPIKNGGRHSYISYRCAETKDIAAVADEVGNSVGVIKKCYRAVVEKSAAKKYFAIRPATVADNVIDMSSPAAEAETPSTAKQGRKKA